MSDNNVPFEIQVEIIKRLPLKSLIQFRTVSKTWKATIDGADFIARYNGQKEHLLVGYHHFVESKPKYILVVDDDTFPNHKVSPTIAPLVNITTTIGSSHGLLCLCDDYQKGHDGPVSATQKAVIWNPSIRKAFALDVPNVTNGLLYGIVLGFGVCRETIDPKIVKIMYINKWRMMESISCIPWQVEVFTLSAGVWRLPYGNLPSKTIQFNELQEGVGVALDGLLYWPAADRIAIDGTFRSMIVSFDMTSEEFREIYLLDVLARMSIDDLGLNKLKESLVVLEDMSGVWIMEDGVPKSFTKLFSIDNIMYSVWGLRKRGEAVIENEETRHGASRTHTLAVYEHDTKRIVNLGIKQVCFVFFVCSYIESLLLLDQPNSMLFDTGI